MKKKNLKKLQITVNRISNLNASQVVAGGLISDILACISDDLPCITDITCPSIQVCESRDFCLTSRGHHVCLTHCKGDPNDPRNTL